MTEPPQSPGPAGWYRDPWGSSQWRWWDGQAWTQRTDPPVQAQWYSQKPRSRRKQIALTVVAWVAGGTVVAVAVAGALFIYAMNQWANNK